MNDLCVRLTFLWFH